MCLARFYCDLVSLSKNHITSSHSDYFLLFNHMGKKKKFKIFTFIQFIPIIFLSSFFLHSKGKNLKCLAHFPAMLCITFLFSLFFINNLAIFNFLLIFLSTFCYTSFVWRIGWLHSIQGEDVSLTSVVTRQHLYVHMTVF